MEKVIIKKLKTKKLSIGAKLFIVLFLAYPLIHLLIFNIYVNFETLALSLQRVDIYGKYKFNGIENFIKLFKDFGKLPMYKDAFINSILFFPLNLLVITPLSVLFSYYMYKKVLGTPFFRVVFFFPSIISIVALTMVYRFMFDIQYGPIPEIMRMLNLDAWIPNSGFTSNNLAVSRPIVYLYCVWSGIGYNIVFMQGAITRIPSSVTESAQIDGAGMYQELVHIIIPMIFSTLSTLILISSTAPFTIFLQPKLITGENGMKTFALLIVNLASGNSTNQISSATLGLILLLIGTPVMLLIRKFLEKLTPEVEI